MPVRRDRDGNPQRFFLTERDEREAQAHRARMENLKRTVGARVPFCPLDLEREHYARRDAVSNFLPSAPRSLDTERAGMALTRGTDS